jgi:hypothetical protein
MWNREREGTRSLRSLPCWNETASVMEATMRSANRTVAVRAAGAAVLAFLLSGAVLAATPKSSQPAQGSEPQGYAVWTPKQLRFVYQGFTSKYSCDGLAEKIRGVLLKLGARKDLQVAPTPCSGGLGTPTPFPGVTIRMHVLETASGKEYDPAAPPVPAHWKSVSLTSSGDPIDAAGDCELVEQIKQRILPLFTTRNVNYSSNCIPYQLSVGGTRLTADVLVAAREGAAPAPAAGPGKQ